MDGRTRGLDVATTSQEPFILAYGLGLNTARVRGYSGVDLSLDAGRAHAICAEHRSGKTELLLTLAGRMHASEGTLAIAGMPIATVRDVNRVRRMAGLGFFDNVNDVEPALPVRTVASAELSLAGRRNNRAATLDYLGSWGLDGVAERAVASLPRYTYDRLGIALGMVFDPVILVVHDVERDLTCHQSLKLVNLLREIAASRATTIVCGTTDYDVAVAFDSATCITDDARRQRDAYDRAHAIRGQHDACRQARAVSRKVA